MGTGLFNTIIMKLKTELSENIIIKNAVSAFIEDPKLTINIYPKSYVTNRSFIERLKFWRTATKVIGNTEIELVFTPPYIGTMYRIANRALDLPEFIAGDYVIDAMLPVIKNNMDDVLYIIASALTNEKKEPSRAVIEMLRWGLKYEQIYECFSSILSDEDMQSFLNSIALVRGAASILKPKVNPVDGSGLIASHKAQ